MIPKSYLDFRDASADADETEPIQRRKGAQVCKYISLLALGLIGCSVEGLRFRVKALQTRGSINHGSTLDPAVAE